MYFLRAPFPACVAVNFIQWARMINMIAPGIRPLQYAAWLLFLSALPLVTTSCGSSGRPKAHALPVAKPTQESPNPNASWVLEPISKDPLSYKRIKPPTVGGSVAYLTIIEQCGLKQPKVTPSIARQLLVGFNGLRIDRIESREVSGTQYVRTVATAQDGESPVTIVSYSQATTSCLRDHVLWFAGDTAPHPGSADLDSEIAMFETQLQGSPGV